MTSDEDAIPVMTPKLKVAIMCVWQSTFHSSVLTSNAEAQE